MPPGQIGGMGHRLFPLFTLSIEGLEDAVAHLRR